MVCSQSGCIPSQDNEAYDLAGATQLALGSGHGCAVMADTSVACWGGNDQGQLGHAPGTETDEDCPGTSATKCTSRPSTVQGLSGAVEVAVGGTLDGSRGFSCARLADGSVRCWGDNSKGQVTTPATRGGPGPDRNAHATPSRVMLSGAALQITANGQFACAVLGGLVTCWGEASSVLWSLPEFIPRLEGGDNGAFVFVNQATDLSCGNLHLCMLRRGGVLCYGTNLSSQLGRADSNAFDMPCTIDGQPMYCSAAANPVSNFANAVRIGAGTNHTCVLLDDHSVRCWGSNSSQQLGYELKQFGDLGPRATPAKVQGLP